MIYGAYLSADLYERAEKFGITVDGNGESEHLCYGLSMDEIKDDETGAQFKRRAHDLLKKFCMENGLECPVPEVHQDAWFG
jgi:hypothetical protein